MNTFNIKTINSAISDLTFPLSQNVRKLWSNVKSKDLSQPILSVTTIRALKGTELTDASVALASILALAKVKEPKVDVVLLDPVSTLSSILSKLSNLLEKEEPELLRSLRLKPRQTRKKTRFGIEVELMVSIARLINRPLNDDMKWSSSLELDSVDDILESLSVSTVDESSFLDAIEGVRESYSYHSFVSLDENGIAESIIEGTFPDEDELKSCVDTVCQILCLESFNIPSFDIDKWNRAESKALLRAQELLSEANADRQALADLNI